ncbi:JmjC domain containing protein 4 [Echinococcus multilocularis]|uniref:Jumonji domain-containing protein 4 n=1 Tax=Echinococcus multilocularis TaxID=6211 RepID=A0A087W0Y7_ECHMU|nr:JmjC domain containing protein 4 [Echinococcus multilocularis]
MNIILLRGHNPSPIGAVVALSASEGALGSWWSAKHWSFCHIITLSTTSPFVLEIFAGFFVSIPTQLPTSCVFYMSANIPASIPYLDITYKYCDFYAKFLHLNLPCLFTESHTCTWPARLNWSENGSISIDRVLKPFSGSELCVANCRDIEFGAHRTLTMTSEEYLAYWKIAGCDGTEQLLYLKDWHYFKGKDFRNYYSQPVYFSSDWLNEFYEFRTDCDDDFRFVYIGPVGTWTPLHTDVHCSYSWSANIVGRKRWWVFPPGEENKLIVSHGGQLPSDISQCDFADPGTQDSDLPRCYVFDQQPGEMFFVPSGWYHQVLNLTDCISINNNWLNACNVTLVWRHLQAQLREVKKSCSDVESTPGWDDACQECLKAWEGWNYREFFVLLKYILISRWLRLTVQEVRQRLPTVATIPGGGKVPLHVLDEQVESLLSDIASSEPLLVKWLTGDTLDSQLQSFVDVETTTSVSSIWKHDLVEATRAIRSMVVNEDLKRLCLHSRGPAAWLWKIVLSGQV